MTPEEISKAYEVLAQNVATTSANEAARIGNAQRSLGLMAERVANTSGQSGTTTAQPGLANYTYNRLMRPSVDSMAAALVTQGKAKQLDKYLSDALRAAKSNYENAQYAPKTPTTTNPSNTNNPFTEKVWGSGVAEQVPFEPAGEILGTASSGNGYYDLTIADGKGGSYRYQVKADSPSEAILNYRQNLGWNTNQSAWDMTWQMVGDTFNSIFNK